MNLRLCGAAALNHRDVPQDGAGGSCTAVKRSLRSMQPLWTAPIAMVVAFLHLTTPTGKPVLVRPDQIQVVREAGAENPPGSRAVIVSANGFQAVRESVQEIDAMLAKLRE